MEVVVVRGLHFNVHAIRGTVGAVGQEPTALQDVTVTVRRLGGGPALHVTTTSSVGEFSFQGVAPGWYQVETCREGLNSMIVPVLVDPAAPEERVVRITLSISA